MSAQRVGPHSATLPEHISLRSGILKSRLHGHTVMIFLDQILVPIVGDICVSAPHPELLSCQGVLHRIPFVQGQKVVVELRNHTLII